MKRNQMKDRFTTELFFLSQGVRIRLVSLSLLLLGVPTAVFSQEESFSSKRFDPSRFKESSLILIGKLPIRVTPRREYLIKAASSGQIELYVPPKPGNFKAGDRLGGIDVERLKLDEELMELGESLLREKEIPQWYLQRKNQIDQLKTQLAGIRRERELAKQMLADPEKYSDLFKVMKAARDREGESMEAYLSDLQEHQEQLVGILDFIQSSRKEELEIGELNKKFELKKLQFDIRRKDAFLTVPFDGRVTFIFPYVTGEKNYVALGTDLALVRDSKEVYGQVPILDSKWRLLDQKSLELEVSVAGGVATGHYSKSLRKELSGSEALIYSFLFDSSDNALLMNQMSGKVEGKVFLGFDRPVRLVPKFLLVALSPGAFREGGWKGLLQSVAPDYELLQVGLQSVALVESGDL